LIEMTMPGAARSFLLTLLTATAVSTSAASLAPTPPQTEGPYYKPGSPQRHSLIEHGMPGTKLVLTGRVLTTDGTPVKRAWLDFWQSDANGRYDNKGYRLRGHQYTDDAGRYTLETVLPASYPGRTPHVHVKIAAPNRPALTTQLYFPGESLNREDGLFDSGLLVQWHDGGSGKQASFDFVLELSAQSKPVGR
jgi:protocatechuate 3,4-dioxygenase beta subunit